MFSFIFVHTRRSTTFEGMSKDELEEEYIRRFFTYHMSTNTPPMAYLTWKVCQHTPSLMTNELLTGLDWDTITGLFDRVGTVKTTHVDMPMVTRSWAARADYDLFCPGGTILHNRALALFLSPNINPLVQTDHPELKNFVFSAVVVFKPASQNTCNLVTGVTRLLDFFDKRESSMALVSLSDTADYFPYPDEADRVDYAVVPADNLHTRSVGPASSFMFGRLIQADIKGVMHVVLPPAFEKDLDNTDFDWVPCPVRGSVWANAKLVDAEGENLMHEAAVAHAETYHPDPGDKIRSSALGLHPVPLCKVTHLYDIEVLGYDKAMEFMARVKSTDAPPRPEAPMQVDDGPSDDSTPQGKANGKCKPKSSANMPDSTGTQPDSVVGTSETTVPQEVETIEVVGEADNADQAEEGETQEKAPSDDMTPNQVKELLHGLMRKSTILDDCRSRVHSAVSKAIAERTKAMFKPFTGYIEDMGREVSSWHAGIPSVRPQMVDCSYEKYWENSGLIREKTNAFYERARALNKTLDSNVHPTPAARDDSGISDADVDAGEDPFQAEIPNIMMDVEESVAKYADEMAKKVLEYTGGADISSYLGHIFSTGLNFQTLMWQLVTFEAVYLPTVMREQLRRDASTLRIFVECLPTLAPCAIPPPPFPTASAIQALTPSPVQTSQPSSSTVVADTKVPAGAVKAVPTSSASQTSAATTPKPVAAPRVKVKVSPVATNTALDKAVGRVAPVHDTQSGPTQTSVSTGHLAGLAQASSTIRSRPRSEISPNSQPTVKRPRMDGTAGPAATASSTPGSSSAAAISIDDDDEIQFVDVVNDGASVHVNAHGTQMTTSSSTPGALDDELMSEYPEQVKIVINRLRRNHYSADFPWMQDLYWRLPQGNRNSRNIDSMVAHVLAMRESDPYIKKSFISVESILKGDEDPEFFDADFKKTLTNVRRNQTFKSPPYSNMKSFQFDYLLACFLDEDGKPFPANDKRFWTQMTGLSSLHSVPALSRPKIHSQGVLIEKIFCPHCGYFVNNPYTMSTHIRMHYRAGMFCAHKGCNYITNKPEGMVEHGESKHLYGTRTQTPSKAKK